MANKSDIEISLDGRVANDSAKKAAQSIIDIVRAAGSAEEKIKAINAALKQMETAAGKGASGQTLKHIELLGRALQGSFSEAALKIKAVQGELLKAKAQTINATTEILNHQASAARKLQKALQESQVQTFMRTRNRGFEQETDLVALRLRMEAERRRIAMAEIQGQPTPKAATERLEKMIELQKKLQEATKPEKVNTFANRLLETQLRQAQALNDVERQGYKIMETKLRLREAIRQSAGQETAEVRRLNEQLAQERRHLEAIKAAQQKAATTVKAPQTPQELAARSMEINRARFDLNGGADLFKLQTQILANYRLVTMAIQTLRNAFTFVTDFEANLKQLQAITGATTIEVKQLGNTFNEVAKSSKFSGVEIAQAATIMGQAGLSTQQIQQSIRSVIQLATATGTDLKQAVDIATSTMSVFNLRASEMANVADMITAALNVSKLDAEKFALSLQYAGNIAVETGVSLTEMTTALSVMANAGIKSGSTLGTGLRQLMQDLATPSEKFKEALDRLGISISQVDIRTQGLFGVLKNLRDGGFTAAEAMKSMELRGAAALAALYNQIDDVDNLRQQIALMGDAAEANAIQMDSVQAAWKRLGSVAGALASQVSGPMINALKAALNGFTELLSILQDNITIVQTLVTIVGTAAVAAFGKWVATLVFNLTGIKSLVAGLGTLVTAMTTATTAAGALNAVLNTLGRGNIIFLALSAAAAVLINVFDVFGNKLDDNHEKLERAKTDFQTAKGAYDAHNQTVKALGDEIKKLSERHSQLSKDSSQLNSVIADLNNRFKDMGFYVAESGASVDELIVKLRDLQQQQLRGAQVELRLQQNAIDRQREAQIGILRGLYSPDGTNSMLSKKVYSRAGVSYGLSGTDIGDPYVIADPSQNPMVLASRMFMRDVIEKVQAQAVDFSDRNEIDAEISRLMGFIQQINERRKEIKDDTTDEVKRLSGAMEQLALDLEDRVKKLKQLYGLDLQSREIENRRKAIDFRLSGVGAEIVDLQTSINRELSQIEEEFARDLRQKGGIITDEQKRKHRDRLLALYKSLSDQYAAIMEKVDKDATLDRALQQSGLKQEMDLLVGKIKSKTDDADTAIDKIDEGRLEAQRRRIRATIDRLMSQVDKKTPLGTIEKIPEDLAALYDELANVEKRLAAIRRKEKGTMSRAAHMIETDEEIDERNRQDLQKNVTTVRKFIDESNKAFKDAADRLGRLPVAIKELGESFTKVINKLQLTTDASKFLVEQQQAKIEGMQSRLNGNANRISEVEIKREQREIERLQMNQSWTRLYGLRETIPQLNTLYDQGTALRAEYQRRQQAITDYITQNRAKLSEHDVDRYEAERMTLRRQEVDLNNELLKIDEKRKALRQEEEQLTITINEKLQKREGMGIGEGFIEALRQWREEVGLTKNFNATLIDSFKDVFNAGSNALAQFAQDVATRTKSISQAFKDMVRNIAQALLQIVTNRLAASLLGSALRLFDGGGSPGLNRGIGDFTGEGGAGFSYTTFGGPRALGGKIVGGVPNRDSVLTPTMPGEYVVRKPVVDALGEDFMNRLNAMGPRALDMKVPVVAMNDNKEGATVNVWMVTEDQVPPPGPRDIIATVSKDIATGGPIKKLIKQVSTGQL